MKKAEQNASRKITTKKVEKEYNGLEQGVEKEGWYTGANLDKNATITYYDATTSSVMSTKPKNVGNYEAEITLKNDDYYWENEPNKSTIKVAFTIVKKKLEYPKFFDGNNAMPYAGGDNVEFQLEEFESTYIKIEVPSKYGSDVKYNDTSQSITATKVGKYEMTVTLTDTANTEWEAGTHKLEFEVTKAKVGVAITDDSSSSSLTGAKGSVLNVNLEVDHNMLPHDDNTVSVEVYAKADRLPTVKIGEKIDLTNAEVSYLLALDLTNLRAGVRYTLEIKTDSGDYEIELEPCILDVTEAPTRTVLTWELYCDGSKVRGVYKDKLLSDADKTETLDSAITYNGKAHLLRAKLPNGYSLDTSQGIGGYKVEYVNTDNSNVGTNADKYTTTIWLKNNSDGSVEEYSISWEIEKAKYDLSQVKWEYDGKLPYDKINGSTAKLDPKTMPEGLLAEYEDNTGANVGDYGTAYVTFKLDSGYEENYVLPDEYDPTTFIDEEGEFEWTKTWNIVKARIQTGSWKNATQTDINGNAFDVKVLRDPLADGGIVTYEYYETDATGKKISDTAIKAEDIVYSDSEVKFYVAKPILVDNRNYELDDSNAESRWFKVGKALTKVQVELESKELEYNTNPRHVKIKVSGESVLPENAFELTYYEGYTKLNDAPKEVGIYRVEVTLKSEYADKYEIEGEYDFEFEIVKGKIAIDWNTQAKPNVLNLKYGQIYGVEYEIVDSEDNVVDYKDLKAGNTYRIRAKIKESEKNHFIFEDGSTETGWQEFSVSANDKLTDPNDPTNPYYPQEDPDAPNTSGDPTDPGDDKDGNSGLDKFEEFLQKYWQPIVTLICIILILIFTGKGIGYASKRKKAKKTIEKKYSTYYAAAGTGLFGLTYTNWTIVACVMMGVTVLSLIFMILEKKSYSRAEEELEEAKEEYARNREETMYMRMNGGQQQAGFAYAGQGLGADEIRGIVSETMTAMLPNFQQYLPQQASNNDELVEKLVEQNSQNEERIKELTTHNEEVIKNLAQGQEKLMKQLAKQQSVEKIVEREVAATTVSDEVLERLASKLQPATTDDTIKRILDNQEKLMEKILELSANQQTSEPQVIEKIVEKEVPVEVEKVVEKVVEVPVEKIVEKEIPVEVEKIVEKEVVKEVKVEVPVEIEKVVEKIVEIPAAKPAPKARVTAPRLTLDEAYAKLSAKQKKIFDTLKAYALSKDKCKEKKSTYSILLGQSSVNPLVKLTIKKDTTVALFKMEDEFMKDIRRNATNDGTKVKVKETELIVADMQALATAKEMVDLR
ncbi:MAG: hypothetical protein K2O95_02065, partial [Clostridia bacterium]|nr:hypothetical protein [Clostridia bacterium]